MPPINAVKLNLFRSFYNPKYLKNLLLHNARGTSGEAWLVNRRSPPICPLINTFRLSIAGSSVASRK